MVTTNQAVDAIVRRLGFDPPRTAAVARRLTEAGVLPSGSPKHPPELDVEHVVDLVIGCAIDVPLRAVAEAVRTYRSLTPRGINLANAPASIDTAGRALDIWSDIATHGDSNVLRRDRIEVVSNWPELAIHTPDTARRFVAPGALTSHWQAGGHRKSTTINGAALVDALRELFGDKDA